MLYGLYNRGLGSTQYEFIMKLSYNYLFKRNRCDDVRILFVHNNITNNTPQSNSSIQHKVII